MARRNPHAAQKSQYPVGHRIALLECGEVREEMPHKAEPLVPVAARGVRGYVAVGRRPEGMARRKGLGGCHVQVCGSNPARLEALEQRLLVHGGPPAQVVEPRSRLEAGDPARVDVAARRIVLGKDVDAMVRLGQDLRQAPLRDYDDAGFAPDLPPHGIDPHRERDQQLGEPPSDRAEAEHDDRLAGKEPRLLPHPGVEPAMVPELLPVGRQELARQREHHGEPVLGARVGEGPGGVREYAPAGPHPLAERLVVVPGVARGRGLDPAQATALDAVLRARLAIGHVRVQDGAVARARREDGPAPPVGKHQPVGPGPLREEAHRLRPEVAVAPDLHGPAGTTAILCSSAAFPSVTAYRFKLKYCTLPPKEILASTLSPRRRTSSSALYSTRNLIGATPGFVIVGKPSTTGGMPAFDVSTTRTVTVAPVGSGTSAPTSTVPVSTRPGSPSGVRSTWPQPHNAIAAAAARMLRAIFMVNKRWSSPGPP